ncbi:MAG: LysR family transcriptional regulator [Roseitalea sp.]|nr:LysR family transcriptional regulator [Roseitalea sp.]MBO6953780.1 LysR family transcriptional regulator [Rhizobiaceae bacterium]MBO6594128.1 LysR family transcriptional regulator [Roseitalea sp.]MBO6601439.1 LysR family transcriptional regulator [Roseitalea sp.]MBO6613529.1 LysR family transcriptional regulator [Roseitalea sp.]
MDDLRGFDLNLLIVFEAVYTAGNVSHAAKRLGLSQPTLSNSLNRLRELLDDPLFVRSGQGVKPTAKAVSIIGPVREALQMIRSGVAQGDGFDPQIDRRHFRLVLLDQLEPVLMPPLVRQIQNHRNLTLEMLHIAYEPVIEGLNDGSLDLALAPHFPEAREVEQETVGHANVVMVARKDHPEIDETVTLEQFQRIGQIALIPKLRAMTRMDEFLRHAGIGRHIAYTSSKFWSFPHMIATTDLIAMLPGDFAREAARFYPLQLYPMPFDLPNQQVYMIWKANRTNEPSHRWLRDQIRQAYAALPALEV